MFDEAVSARVTVTSAAAAEYEEVHVDPTRGLNRLCPFKL